MILNTMWPMLLDMSRDECKRILRRLELEAYSNVVSALRAQGALTKDKRKLLQDLASILNISLERHRAEVRRAVNDEKLATIAEHMAGPNTSTQWAIEGRRLIPLMPRLVPQTAFTALANKMANITASENAKLPPPAQTLKLKEPIEEFEFSCSEPICGLRRSASSSSWNVLPIKRSERDDERLVKRQCCSSSELLPAGPAQTESLPLPQAKVTNLPSPQTFTQQLAPSQPELFDHQNQPSSLPQTKKHLINLPQSQIQQCDSQQSHSQQLLVQQQSSFCQLQQLQQQQQLLQNQHQLHQLHATKINQESNKDSEMGNTQCDQQGKLLKDCSVHMSTMKSQDSVVSTQPSQTVSMQAQPVIHNRLISGGNGSAPVKITLTSSLGRTALCNIGTATTTTLTTTSPVSTTQKVIIVQSSNTAGSPGSPSILQRSLTVPVVKSSQVAAASVASGGTNSTPRASLIISGHTGSPPVTPTTIVTISTNPINSDNVTATTVSIGGVPTTAYITSPGSIPHTRPKAVQLPSRMRPRAGSIVIPVTPNTLSGVGLPGVTLKTPVQTSRSGSHVKTECSSMKVVPVASGPAGNMKILPKPSFGSGGSPTPMYVMSSTTSSISMVTRTISASGSSSRVVTVNATTLPSCASSVQGRPITTTLVSKSAPGTGPGRTPTTGKPNVIVVQKGSGGTFSRGISVSGGKGQNFPSTLQDVLKVVGNKTLGVSGSGSIISPIVSSFNTQKTQQQSPHISSNSQTGNVVVLDLSHENIGKTMLLADILHASGITNETDLDAEKGRKQEQSHVSSVFSVPVDVNNKTQIHEENYESIEGSTVRTNTVEVTGELDPQTGIYSIHSEPDQVSQSSSITIVPSEDMDIFSTALTSTDINLDSFQSVEERIESMNNSSHPSGSIEVAVKDETNQIQIGEQLHFLQEPDPEPTAVMMETSNIDSSRIHIEEYASQKATVQRATE